MICVDSEAALGAPKNPTIELKLVWECRSVLDELCSVNKLSLIWIPDHYGIKANKRVEVLSKIGSKMTFMGLEYTIIGWFRAAEFQLTYQPTTFDRRTIRNDTVVECVNKVAQTICNVGGTFEHT